MSKQQQCKASKNQDTVTRKQGVTGKAAGALYWECISKLCTTV